MERSSRPRFATHLPNCLPDDAKRRRFPIVVFLVIVVIIVVVVVVTGECSRNVFFSCLEIGNWEGYGRSFPVRQEWTKWDVRWAVEAWCTYAGLLALSQGNDAIMGPKDRPSPRELRLDRKYGMGQRFYFSLTSVVFKEGWHTFFFTSVPGDASMCLPHCLLFLASRRLFLSRLIDLFLWQWLALRPVGYYIMLSCFFLFFFR